MALHVKSNWSSFSPSFLFIAIYTVLVGNIAVGSHAEDQLHCHVNKYVYEENAQARLAVMMSLRQDDVSLETNHKTCSLITRESLQNLLAVEWTLDRLNTANGGAGYINNVTFGFDGLDDCRNPTYASRNALSFVDPWLPETVATCSGAKGDSLQVGIVGPSRSSIATRVASLFQDLHMPMVSMAASAAELADKTRFPTFFRTAASDEHQMTLIVDILEKLSWTYVVVIYEDDVYGNSAVKILQQKAVQRHICIRRAFPIPSNFLHDLANKVYDVQQEAKDYSLAVVFIGNRVKAEQILWEIDEKGNSQTKYGLHFIFSDAVNVDTTVFGEKDFGQGTIAIGQSGMFLQDLYNDMKTKFQNVKVGKERHELLEAFIQENPGKSLLDSNSLNSFVPLTVHAVMALAHALKIEHSLACNGQAGLCETLIENVEKGQLLKQLFNMTLEYRTLPQGIAPAAFVENSMVLSFDESGEMKHINQVPIYKIYQYQRNSRQYIEVGSYVDGVTTFDSEKVMMLRPNGFAARKVPSSVCSERCDDCLNPRQIPLAYMEGDAYILGVLSIHDPDSNNPFGCGRFRTSSSDAIQAEGFLFAVKELRRITGINFGAVLMDDCYSPSRINSQLSDFFAGLLDDNNLFPFHFPREKLVGVMACLSSGCAIPTASFFMPLKVPVVSHSASSPDLDDKVRFPYFLRTVPTDTYQAQVMLDVVRAMEWEYVGLMYVENNYGTKGMQEFKKLAMHDDSGVCVAKEVGISATESTMDPPEFFKVYTTLMAQDVKVVVFFGIDSRYRAFLKYLEEHSQYGKFIFLASEEWGDSMAIASQGLKAARGSITLKVESMGLEGREEFRNHLLNKQPGPNDSNIWFREFWQDHFNCYFEGGFINNFPIACHSETRLKPETVDNYLQDQRVVHLMNAVHALGKGLMSANQKICESGFPCKFLQQYVEDVYGEIKVQSVKEGSLDVQLFDEAGNGALGFDVYNVQQDGAEPSYVKVGSFNSRDKELERDKIRFYSDRGQELDHLESKCTVSRCSHCAKSKSIDHSGIGSVKGDNSCSLEDFRTPDILIISLVVVLFLAVCVAIAVAVLCCVQKYRVLSKKLERKEDQIYAEPETRIYQGDYLQTHGMVFANLDNDPYRLSNDSGDSRDKGHPPAPHRGLSNPSFANDRLDSVSQVLQPDALSYRSQPTNLRARMVPANSGPVSRSSAPQPEIQGGRVMVPPSSASLPRHELQYDTNLGHENPAFLRSPSDSSRGVLERSLSPLSPSNPGRSMQSSIVKMPVTMLTSRGSSDTLSTTGDSAVQPPSQFGQQPVYVGQPQAEPGVVYYMEGADGQLSAQLSPQVVYIPQTSRVNPTNITHGSSVRSDASSTVNPDYGPYSTALAQQKQAAKAAMRTADSPIYVLDPSAVELQALNAPSTRVPQHPVSVRQGMAVPPTENPPIQYASPTKSGSHTQPPLNERMYLQQPQYLPQQVTQAHEAELPHKPSPVQRTTSQPTSRRSSGAGISTNLNASIPDLVDQLSHEADAGVLESVDLNSSRESLDDVRVSTGPHGNARFKTIAALAGGNISRV